MIVEPAPQFGASGAFLAAPFSLDFNKDLAHHILVEGTWQGDRKRALSLHIDNYNNNFALTVVTGSSTVKVPAYSDGYVNLRGFDAVSITSDGANLVPVFLTTQENPTGFTARGNPPNTSVGGPLSYYGSVNLSASNVPVFAGFDSVSGNVFVVTNTGLIIAIDPVKFAIVSIFATQIANVITCAALGSDKIVLCNASGVGSSYSVYTLSTGVLVILGVAGNGATTDITYNPNDGNFYFLRIVNGASIFKSLFNNAGSVAGTQVNTAGWNVQSGSSKIFYNSFDQKVYATVVPVAAGSPQLVRYNSASIEESINIDPDAANISMSFMCGGPANKMYVGGFSANNIYRLTVAATFASGTVKKVALTGGAFALSYNSSTLDVYTGQRDVLNTGLDGLIGAMPVFNPVSFANAMCYVPTNSMTCFATNSGIVYFGK